VSAALEDTAVEASSGAEPSGAAPRRPARRLPRWAAGPRAVRVAVVVGVLLLLELATLHGWLSGAAAPQWDFYNQYNTEAWAWWRDASPSSQPQWMPYAWGGYPALLDAQNSSWYLPVGIMTILGPFTIQASAVLSALHVAFGALGAYLLVRSLGVRFPAALLALVVWFFAAGSFSNASHLDISRAWAWTPWLVWVLSHSWRWDRWWRWVLAGLVVWQGLLSLYPGILVACVYVGAAYVVVTQLVMRPRPTSYLVPLAVAVAGGAAMTTLRYLPLFLTRGAGAPSGADASQFPARMVGAFLYPYGNDTLLNDVTMRSFFLAAPVFALLAFVPWASRRIRPALALVVVAGAMGLPVWPWHDVLRQLPGMSLSRFTMSDFKPLLLLGVVLLAAWAADDLLRRGADRERPRVTTRFVVAAAVTALLCGAFFAVGVRGAFDPLGWVTQYALLLVAVVAVWAAATRPAAAVASVAVLVALAAASGSVAVLATTAPWTSDRASTESAAFGASVDSLVARYPAVPPDALQRPARLAPEGVAQPEQALSTLWGRAFYTGESSVMGYVNLKGSDPFEQMNADLFTGDDREAALAFWAAPGVLVAGDGDDFPTTAQLASCVDGGSCGSGLSIEPAGYSSGHLSWAVSAETDTTVTANESSYPGWHAEACRVDDATDCTDLVVEAGARSQVVTTVPAGDWTVSLDYRLPGERASFLAAGLGAVLLVAGGAVAEVVRRRRRAEQR